MPLHSARFAGFADRQSRKKDAKFTSIYHYCWEIVHYIIHLFLRLLINQYPLVNIQKAIEAMAIEIVDLPIENGGSFHSFLLT